MVARDRVIGLLVPGANLSEVARKIGVSRERVRQLSNEILGHGSRYREMSRPERERQRAARRFPMAFRLAMARWLRSAGYRLCTDSDHRLWLNEVEFHRGQTICRKCDARRVNELWHKRNPDAGFYSEERRATMRVPKRNS